MRGPTEITNILVERISNRILKKWNIQITAAKRFCYLIKKIWSLERFKGPITT
jgi:hypothetical protein